MHSFKKIFLPLICIALIFFGLSTVILEPYLRSEAQYYQDSDVRDSLAGKLDFIAIGASNGLCALDPQILDQELGCFSYNLSGSLTTLNSSRFLLEKELNRNPVDTVVIDFSYETLTRISGKEHGEGDSVTYARLSSLGERIKFLLTCVPLNDWLSIYAYHFIPEALEYAIASLKGDLSAFHNVDANSKGFMARRVTDLELDASKAQELYNSEILNTSFRRQNEQKLISLIELCKKRSIRVILASYPRSNAEIWRVDGQDIFYQFAKNFAKEQDCEFYDMNLLKRRYELFNDRESFYDSQHMSAQGAAVFTKVFCDIIKKAETEDISESFYRSYEEMKADSPYMAYLPE